MYTMGRYIRRFERKSSNFGFTIMNVVSVDADTYVRCPNLFKKHGAETAICDPKQVAGFLYWAKCIWEKIDPDNVLEGMTYAMTTVKENDKFGDTQLFKCHVDNNNSESRNWDFCIIANSIWLYGESLKWISLIGYSRKAIDHYYQRLQLFQPVLEVIEEHHSSLTKEQRMYGYKTLLDRKCTKIIEGKIIARLPNMEKNCFCQVLCFYYRR
jgi:hypothetical protein